MKYEVIGWTTFDDPDYKAVEDSVEMTYLSTTVIKEIRKCGYRFSGDRHANKDGYAPVFNSGEKFCTSRRQWGAIMAQAWHEDNSEGMAYNVWQLAWDGEDDFIYPVLGVDKSRLAKDVELEYEPLLDEEYYVSGPRSREEYEAWVRETLEEISVNHPQMLDGTVEE